MRPTASGTVNVIERFGVLFVLVIVLVSFSLALPHTFFTQANFDTIISSQSAILLLVLASAFPLRTGNFDISVANVMIFSGTVMGVCSINHHWPILAAVLLGMVAAGVCGIVNGFLVVVIGIDSLVATLGMSTVYAGISYALTNTQVLSGFSPGLERFAQIDFLNLPGAVWAGWALAIVVWVVFEFVPFGRKLLFIGGNRQASQLVGLPVRRLIFTSFVLASLIAGVAGMILAGSLGSLDPTSGTSYLLPPLAAVFLGAATIQVGRINIVGAVIAMYLLAAGVTGLELFGASDWVSQVFQGATLVVAVGVSSIIRVRRRSAG